MMRAPTKIHSKSRTPQLRAFMMALAVSAAFAAPLSAQSNPRGFSLPQPTPTPTSAPQGPVDIRDGVVIGPRQIPDAAPSPTPTPAPSPDANRTPAATEPAAQTPAPAGAPAAASPSLSPAPSRSSPPPARNRDAATAAPPPAPLVFEPSESEIAEPGVNDEGFYAVDRPDNAPPPETPAAGEAASEASIPYRTMPDIAANNAIILSALGALLLLIGALAFVIMRRRKNAAAEPSLMPAPALAAGVRKSIAETRTDTSPVVAKPASAPPTPPSAAPPPLGMPQMALRLDIASTTRSMMMITVEYRLNIANRADRALRDLAVSAKLVCARRNAAAPAPAPAPAGEQPLQLVERIGPHQSRTISGTLQLPIAEISPLRQGDTPLLVPLIELKIEASGQPAKTHKFVLGLPSASNTARLHPIPLNTPPGGIQGLRANEVKDTGPR